MAAKPSVLVTRCDIPEGALNKLRQAFDVDMYEEPQPMPRAELLARIKGKSGLLCLITDVIDKELLDTAGPSLKVVSTMSVGYDHIKMDEVKQRGIKVGFTPDVLTDATAELTVALLLATSRRFFDTNKELNNGGWLKCSWSPLWMLGRGLAGSTVGIFGLGRIGQAVLQRLAGFGVARFLYNGNSPKQLDSSLPTATFVSFESLLQESDFVICTAALNDATREKFNKQAFTLMKKTAVFVNTSRGGLVDQSALAWALETGEIWAAGLDVMTPEPLPLDDPLNKVPKLTLVPHIGSAEEATRAGMADLAAVNLIAGLTSGAEMKRQLC